MNDGGGPTDEAGAMIVAGRKNRGYPKSRG